MAHPWEGLECLQALADTSRQVMSQLNDGRDSSAQLDSGLQLLLHLQSQQLNSKAKDGSTSTCCIAFFIASQVSRPSQARLHACDMLQATFAILFLIA